MPHLKSKAREDEKKAIRFPIRLLTLACLLTVTGLGLFGWSEFNEISGKDRRIGRVAIISAIAASGTLFVAWLSVAHGVRRWRIQLSESFHHRAEAEENLRKAHAELEQRVESRTSELAKANESLQIENSHRKQVEETLRISEERFSDAFEHAPIGVALLSPDGLWLRVNKTLCDLVGYTEAELLTRTFMDITHPSDLEDGRENVRRTIAGEISSFQMEKRYIHKHGRFITASLNVSLVRAGNGQPLYFIAQIQDVTERKRVEKALRESNEKFQLLADNITDAFWIRSPDMREVRYISPAFKRIWGRSTESLYENPHLWSNFTMHEDRDRVVKAFESLKEELPGLDIEYRILRPDGEIRWVRVRGFQVRDAEKKLIHLTGIVIDITERKQLEAQLLQSQKLETVGKLAGGVAHEFNNILTAIIGHSQLLQRDLSPDSRSSRNVTEIIKAAGRAATLTRQLLAYGRKQFLQPETVDLNIAIASVEIHQLMGKGIETHILCAPDLKKVKVDTRQIEQVIINLALNARDAMPNGGKLTLETSNIAFNPAGAAHNQEMAPGKYVKLSITDTGKGMSEEVKARIFDPFFSTKDVGQGPGLGLSSCYGIIKQSGGHIMVHSELSQGATFEIYLPQFELPTAHPLKDLHSEDLPRGTETILLVEIDPALREMTATLLGLLGYRILTAENGLEALELKQQRDIGTVDLIFTDILMREIDGKNWGERLRSQYPQTRILFTSASSEQKLVPRNALNKCEGFLQKPFTPRDLAKKIREVLDQNLGSRSEIARKDLDP